MPVIRDGECTDAQGCAEKPTFSVEFPTSPPAQTNLSSRTEAHRSVSVRPPTATGNATGLLPELLPADPGLATVVDAWSSLPDAIKAGILALVKAATGK